MSFIQENPRPHRKKPPWLKVRFPSSPDYFQVSQLLRDKRLHSICQSAKCPNIGECWAERTATFLILGDICTRDCAFCAVPHGTPRRPDIKEPQRLAEAVQSLGLGYAVLTSVTRDDLTDGGAFYFAEVVGSLKTGASKIRVEVLIPDFGGDRTALQQVVDSGPDVLNHNLEVPESLYKRINRNPSHYHRSLQLLHQAGGMGALTKSGLMVGLGETEDDIRQALSDLRDSGCRLLTIGQYVQPGVQNIPVARYYSPAEFRELKETALSMGFSAVEAGPLVRSSYRAYEMYRNGLQKTN